jgi:hypothetical protein
VTEHLPKHVLGDSPQQCPWVLPSAAGAQPWLPVLKDADSCSSGCSWYRGRTTYEYRTEPYSRTLSVPVLRLATRRLQMQTFIHVFIMYYILMYFSLGCES